MAFSELYVCNRCSSDQVLVHAEEWTPGLTIAAPLPYTGSGAVGGLLNRLWCPHCRMVQPFPFVVLNPPSAHAVVAYAEAQRIGCDGRETGPCPVCGEPLTWEVENELCPVCDIGHLHFTGEWEDSV